MTARVKKNVNGSLYNAATETFIELDHDTDWADDDPLVVTYPDAFDIVKGKFPAGDKPKDD